MRMPALRAQFPPRLPRGSVRMRLTALYGSLFILSGAAMLAISLWWSSSVSISSANPAPLAPTRQQSPMAQAQARIHQLEYQVSALSDHLRAAQSHQMLTGAGIAL